MTLLPILCIFFIIDIIVLFNTKILLCQAFSFSVNGDRILHQSISLTRSSQSTKLRSSTIPETETTIQDPAEEEQGQKPKQHVVVVGGGVGGLAVAARIASKNSSNNNVKVTILEKNEKVGGRCGSFWVDLPSKDNNDDNSSSSQQKRLLRFRHECGPSLLLLPEIYQQIFTETTTSSKTSKDYGLDIVQCIPAYQVIFDDGDCISVGFPSSSSASSTTTNNDSENDFSLQQQQQISRNKMDSYELNGSQKWDEYMKITSAYLDCGLPNFIEERFDLGSFPNFLIQSLRDNAKVRFC